MTKHPEKGHGQVT